MEEAAYNPTASDPSFQNVTDEPKTATNQINTLSQVLDDTHARLVNIEATLFGPEPTKPEDTAQPIIASIAEALKSVILQANDLDNRVQRIQAAL